jgi:hypothetical protein
MKGDVQGCGGWVFVAKNKLVVNNDVSFQSLLQNVGAVQ